MRPMGSSLGIGRISLTLVLAFTALIELLCNRIGVHVASPAARAGSTVFRIVDTMGLFSFYLTGLLALFVLAWAVVILIADAKLLRLPNRVAVMVAGAAFLPLAGIGLFVRLPASLNPWLNISFGLFVLVAILGFVLRPASVRSKLGLLYLAAPLLLHCYWLATKQMPALAPGGANADFPARLLETGEHLVVVGAFASFLFFAPLPRLSALLAPIPLAAATVLTAGVGLLVAAQNGFATKAARFGFGLNLPTPTRGEVLHLSLHIAAFFFFVLLLSSLTLRGRNERGLALGLLLVALSGFHLELPYQLLLTGVGLLQILRCAQALHLESMPTAPAPTQLPSPAQWKVYLRRLADSCGAEDAESVVLSSENNQIARLRSTCRGLPLSIRLQLRAGLLQEIEVDVGVPPKEDAPASLWRKLERRGERLPDSRGDKLKGYDPLFVARDSTGELGDSLAAYAEPLRRWIHGWLGLWPAEGVQYVMRPLADGWPIPVEAVARDPETAATTQPGQLVELLLELAERLEVR
jgi:hypothetical protein